MPAEGIPEGFAPLPHVHVPSVELGEAGPGPSSAAAQQRRRRQAEGAQAGPSGGPAQRNRGRSDTVTESRSIMQSLAEMRVRLQGYVVEIQENVRSIRTIERHVRETIAEVDNLFARQQALSAEAVEEEAPQAEEDEDELMDEDKEMSPEV